MSARSGPVSGNSGLMMVVGIYAYGFERPSAIQQRAIMPVIKGECSRRGPRLVGRQN